MSDIAEKKIDKNTADLLKMVADFEGKFSGAFNIRSNGGCLGRKSSENIKIESKTDNPGLDIFIAPGTKGETVFIPACVTAPGFDDLVYNDFHVGEGADVTIVAGCGIHTEPGDLGAFRRHEDASREFLSKLGDRLLKTYKQVSL